MSVPLRLRTLGAKADVVASPSAAAFAAAHALFGNNLRRTVRFRDCDDVRRAQGAATRHKGRKPSRPWEHR